MAFDDHKNFAYSTVATAPSPADSGTSLDVQSGDGSKFPTPPFNATVWPANQQPTTSNAEIVRVTAISTDTFTITRAQEGSSARSIQVGDQIAATITAKSLTDIENSMVKAYVSSENNAPFATDTVGSWVDITDVSINITLSSTRDVYCLFDCHVYHTTAGKDIHLRILRNSTVISHERRVHCDSAVAQYPVVVAALDKNVSAGSYTYKVQAYTDTAKLRVNSVKGLKVLVI